MNLHLESIKPGDAITYVRVKNGKEQCSGLAYVGEWLEILKRWRLVNHEGKPCGTFPPDGGGRDFMSKNPNPDFWVSANPLHLAKRDLASKRAARRRAKREAELSSKTAAFHAELNTLLLKYGAEISPVQLSGDDQGVELGLEYSIAL